MAQRQEDLFDAFTLRLGLRISVQDDSRRTSGVRDDFNDLHRSSSTLGRDAQRLEDRLLANPACSERRRR